MSECVLCRARHKRHTWASWHVQHGTSLQELQQLGGWASFEMVLRYAHLSSDHLRDAAARINATIMPQSLKQSFQTELGVSATDYKCFIWRARRDSSSPSGSKPVWAFLSY
jgi:hypothetical protein